MRNTLRLLVLAALVGSGVSAASRFPDPVQDIKVAAAGTQQTAVLAGGCFWGVEAVFEQLAGVSDVVSGYAGGSSATAHYQVVSTGTTGHAESVKITFDPARISYGQLLKIFFAIAHDPTELNRQGPDEGTQYRSAIFYETPEQKTVAEAYIQQLEAARVFPRHVVTQVVPLQGFYPAEAYHVDYYRRNPDKAYCAATIGPKVSKLRSKYAARLKGSDPVRP